jgi:hypothetical protein
LGFKSMRYIGCSHTLNWRCVCNGQGTPHGSRQATAKSCRCGRKFLYYTWA